MRTLRAIRLGNIGEPTRHITFEPIPDEVPVPEVVPATEPEKVPA